MFSIPFYILKDSAPMSDPLHNPLVHVFEGLPPRVGQLHQQVVERPGVLLQRLVLRLDVLEKVVRGHGRADPVLLPVLHQYWRSTGLQLKTKTHFDNS